ncbi:MAG: hypothetical protein JKY50_15865 [Oleispira sp.]|nr:hypothetical protein [Oleispira sp.]MBL4881906.1 hypothetical protein [Oleispira sp.]
MKYYKKLLLTKLSETGWEFIEEDADTDWWLESSWKIKSIKESYGLELYILFLVDPHYDGMNKSSAVWAVGAFQEIPTERPMENGIAVMDMVKGKFDQKLTEFVGDINFYRNNAHS